MVAATVQSEAGDVTNRKARPESLARPTKNRSRHRVAAVAVRLYSIWPSSIHPGLTGNRELCEGDCT